MKHSWKINFIAYTILLVGLLISGVSFLFSFNPLYLVVGGGVFLTLLVYTAGLVTFKLTALVPLGTVDGKTVKLHTLKNVQQFGPPLDANGQEVKPEIWYMLAHPMSQWNKFLLMRVVKFRLVHEQVITPGEKAFTLDKSSLTKGKNYDSYKFEPYEYALTQNETNWDVVGQISRSVDKYITVGKVSTKVFWFSMICAFISPLAMMFAVQPTINGSGWVTVGFAILGYLLAFIGGLMVARNTHPFTLNEEGTQIVLQGNAFKEYFEKANINGVYSLEQNDLEAKYLAWSTAFNQESNWTYVFAVPGSENSTVMIYDQMVSHKDLGFVVRSERLAERIRSLIEGERWQKLFADEPFITNKN